MEQLKNLEIQPKKLFNGWVCRFGWCHGHGRRARWRGGRWGGTWLWRGGRRWRDTIVEFIRKRDIVKLNDVTVCGFIPSIKNFWFTFKTTKIAVTKLVFSSFHFHQEVYVSCNDIPTRRMDIFSLSGFMLIRGALKKIWG